VSKSWRISHRIGRVDVVGLGARSKEAQIKILIEK